MPAILLGILGSWRAMLAIIIAIFVGVIIWKFKALESDLTHQKEALKIEQSNNQVLRNNLDQAGQINADNAKVIETVETDKKRALDAVTQINSNLQKTNQSINEIKQKITSITAPPTKLTPYLVESVKGVQDLRDAENPPTPVPAAGAKPAQNQAQPAKDSASGKKVVDIPR